MTIVKTQTCSLEHLQHVNDLCARLLEPGFFDRNAVAQAFGANCYIGGLEDAISLKPRTAALHIVAMENNHGYAVGVCEPHEQMQLLPYAFETPEKAVIFGLLSWKYRDMVLLATAGVCGNA